MAYFTTRVELHDAKWPDDYVKLHKEMGKEGFTTVVAADNGATFHLPTAEYNMEGNFLLANVLAAAKRAAGRVKPSFEILSTEGIRRTWHNLKPVK